MDKKRTLNVDVGRSIAEFQSVMKEFLLKHRLYKILLRGKGLEFESYRTYSQDDDASAIDWKASKRANNLLVKQYRDERNLKIMFIVDAGANMVFGSSKKLKCEYAAEVFISFSYLILSSGDKVGCLLFKDRIGEYIKPGSGKKHFYRLIDNVTNPNNYGDKASSLETAFDFIINYFSRAINSVVIISDFLKLDKKHEKQLSLISSKFETVALMVKDPLDVSLPEISEEVVIEDPKTGQQLLINPKVAKASYEKIALTQENLVKGLCLKNRIDLLELKTDKDFVPTLAEFLKGRIQGEK